MPRKKSETTEEPKKKAAKTVSGPPAKKVKAKAQQAEAETKAVTEVPAAEETPVYAAPSTVPAPTAQAAPSAAEDVPARIPESEKEPNGDGNGDNNGNGNGNGRLHKHTHPKLGFNFLAQQTLAELRKIAKEIGVTSISARRKDDLIVDILKTQAETMGYRFNGGTLECLPEGYGFLRPSGLLPSSNDIYVSASQIRRFGLRNGDVVWGIIRPPKE